MVREIAAENDITLPEDFKARHFSPDEDIVQFDLVMVMDKFTAADVLREVNSGYLIFVNVHGCNVKCISSVLSLSSTREGHSVPMISPRLDTWYT